MPPIQKSSNERKRDTDVEIEQCAVYVTGHTSVPWLCGVEDRARAGPVDVAPEHLGHAAAASSGDEGGGDDGFAFFASDDELFTLHKSKANSPQLPKESTL